MFCSECGAKIPDEGGFCPDCGTPTPGENAGEQQESDPTINRDSVPESAPAPETTVGFDPTPAPDSTPESAPMPTAAFDPAPAPESAPTPESAPAPESAPTPAAVFDPAPAPTPESAPTPTAAFDPTSLPPIGFDPTPAPTHFPDTTNQYPPPGAMPQYPPSSPAPQYPPPDGVNPNMSQPPDYQQGAPDIKKPKKSKKGLFIALGAALLVILLVVGGFVGFNIYRSSNYDNAVALFESGEYRQAYDAFDKLGDYQDALWFKDLAQQWLDYEAARALLDAEDFEGAKNAFETLSGFEDSTNLALLCQQNIDYLAAVDSYDKGDFDSALTTFGALASAGFSDASDWKDKTSYALAAKLYDEGDFYGAFKAFKALGSYDDSSTRMEQCTTAYPSTGEYYHNGDYVSSASAICIDGGNASYAAYFKIYNGSTLVSTIFLNAGGSCTIEVPPGVYGIKEATGDYWFGEEIMFGDEGYYEVMLFDGGEYDYFDLGDNIITTITLSVSDWDAGSSVGADPTTRENF